MSHASEGESVGCIDCGSKRVGTAYVRFPKDSNYVTRTEEPTSPSDSGYVILRCTDCGSIFLHPHYFDESFAVYSDSKYFTGYFPENIHTGGGPVLTVPKFPSYARRVNRMRAANLLRIAGFKKIEGLRVIDIGCAKGDLVQGLADCGCEASGVDVSSVSTAEARRRGLTVYQGMFEDQAFPDGHFDMIVSTETFEHMAGIDRIASRIRDTLKPNGVLEIQVPNDIEGYRSHFYGDIWWMIPPMHIRYFTAASIENIFSKYGFSLSGTETTGSFGVDVSSIASWLLRKNGFGKLQASGTFKASLSALNSLFRPIDLALNAGRKHSELIAVLRKNE